MVSISPAAMAYFGQRRRSTRFRSVSKKRAATVLAKSVSEPLKPPTFHRQWTMKKTLRAHSTRPARKARRVTPRRAVWCEPSLAARGASMVLRSDPLAR